MTSFGVEFLTLAKFTGKRVYRDHVSSALCHSEHVPDQKYSSPLRISLVLLLLHGDKVERLQDQLAASQLQNNLWPTFWDSETFRPVSSKPLRFHVMNFFG